MAGESRAFLGQREEQVACVNARGGKASRTGCCAAVCGSDCKREPSRLGQRPTAAQGKLRCPIRSSVREFAEVW